MKYSRPPPRATSTTRYCYGMIAILSALVLVLLWLSTQIASPRIAADLSRSDFTVNADQQELAQRILALNGLVDTAAVDRNSRGGLVLQLPYLKTDRFGVTDVELTPPTLHTTDFDDSEPDGTECPPVESARADMPVSMRESGVKHMPPIPTLYEPRAPKALWMPPIPISKDRHDQRLFYVDPKTGLSTTKIVYSLLGRSGAPTVNGANRENWSNQQVTAPEFAPRSLLHTDFLPAAQPTCPQVALRTVAYWHAWSDQQLAAKPLNVLVWHGTWLRTTSEAQKGGPMGELGLFTSTMLALTAMSARVTLLAHPQGEQAMKEALEHFDEYDIILIDTYSADVMTQTGHITNPDVLCRIRALDYWGTPARQNSWGLPDLRQYLVPFACTLDASTPNTLIYMHRYKNLIDGEVEEFHPTQRMRERDQAEREREASIAAHALSFKDAKKSWPTDEAAFEPTANLHPAGSNWDIIPGARDHMQPTDVSEGSSMAARFQRGEVSFHSSNTRVYAKKFQILIWGKEPHYFRGLTDLLRALAEIVPLVTVVREGGMQYFPNVDDLPTDEFGNKRIRHLGIIDQAEMKRHQRESALILGVGDPIFSFTPIEAMQVGTPYLNPNFRPAKSYWMNGDCVITSQHPYCERLGAPQTWNYDPRQLSDVRLIVRTALKWVRETQTKLGGIPSMYPKELNYPNLVKRIHANFQTDFCAAAGRRNTPAHRKT